MEIKILIDDSLKVHENLPEELIKISSWNDDFTFTGSHILAGNPSMVFTYNEYDKIKNKGYFKEGKRTEFNNYIIVSPAYFEYKSPIESFFIKEKIPLRLIDFKDLKNFILNPTNSRIKLTQIKEYEEELSLFEELFNIFMHGKSDSTRWVYREVPIMNTGKLEHILNKFNYDEIPISAKEAYSQPRCYHASKFTTEMRIVSLLEE